ncbi:hypothetical protein [Massilia sp. CF038]|uniref:hypothetical protein n=1 Tax=Massilia sp. CF038 TaxID=1881045 RepID=UPI00091F56ED|nr:hypothetical protein [Massilia sp. CF038]SHH19140.1 hypothetical protein SAMN05428948_3237 [Massilia sp. CF038]
MKRYLHILVRLLVWPLLLLAALYLGLLFINRHDHPIAPEAAQFEQQFSARLPLADRDNGHTYLVGWGTIRAGDPVLQKKKNAARDALFDGCSALDQACRKLLQASDKDIASVLDDEAWMLARYRGMLANKAWQAPLPVRVSDRLPDLVSASAGQRLLMLAAWQHARAGRSQQVGELLESDQRFWRMVFATSDDLIRKMYASVALKRHFEWGNIVLAALPASMQASALPGQWRVPVSIEERSLRRVFLGEYLFTKTQLQDLASEAASKDEPLLWLRWSVIAPLLQPQATMNAYAARLSKAADTLDVDYPQLADALKEAASAEQAAHAIGREFDAYNLWGRATILGEVNDWGGYARKLADIEGGRRAALLTAELRAAGVLPVQVPKRLSQAALRNPYTGAPFVWDARAATVRFIGLTPDERGRHGFVY